MLNLLLLVFIWIFLLVWLLVSIKGHSFEGPTYANAINRLELHLLKSNAVSRQIAVGMVTLTCMVLSGLSFFVNRAYTEYVFHPNKSQFSDLIFFILIMVGSLTIVACVIRKKILGQLSFQKNNLSFSLVQRAKKFNRLFNMGVILFGLCLVIQLAYNAINM